jgi:hypothetical protein
VAERRVRAILLSAWGLGLTLVAPLSATSAPAIEQAFRCRVSTTTTKPVPARPSFNFGNRGVAVALPPRATFAAVPAGTPGGANAVIQKDGSIRTKLGWWAARGTLRVSGRRLDRPAPPLRADVGGVSSTASGPFIPSLLYFSSTGCWKVTATAGGARLQAIVRVVRR